MNSDKTFGEFIVLHERKSITKEFNSIEKDMMSAIKRSSDILGERADADIDKAVDKVNEGIDVLKKVLVKYNLYDI